MNDENTIKTTTLPSGEKIIPDFRLIFPIGVRLTIQTINGELLFEVKDYEHLIFSHPCEIKGICMIGKNELGSFRISDIVLEELYNHNLIRVLSIGESIDVTFEKEEKK